MSSITSYYLIPETSTGSATISAGGIDTSTITDEFSTGIVCVKVQSNGSCQIDIKRSHLTTTLWDVYHTKNIDNTSYEVYVDVRDEKYQLSLTSLEGSDDIKVKGYIIAYDGMAYATVPLFRDVTGISEETVDDSNVARALLDTYDKVNQHTEKTRDDPWLSTEDQYLQIQKAHAFLTAHYSVIKGPDGVVDEPKKISGMFTKWLYLYCLEIYDLTGKYPYNLEGLPEEKTRATPFTGALSMVQIEDTDGDSYTQTSTRS